jgi:hypothetical protein
MSDKQKDLAVHLYPFALGCLDNEDFVKVLNHIRAGEEFPYQELGEYQNLASLLPSFLEIEMPDQSVKDKVARKLYRLKEQKRPDRTTKIESPSDDYEQIKEEPTIEESPVKKDPFSGNIDEDKIRAEFLESSEVEETTTTFESYKPESEPEPEIVMETEAIEEEEVEEEVEEEETFKPVTPFSRRSPELNRPKQETQVSSREKQDKPERDKYEEEQNKFSFPNSDNESLDPYQSFTSDGKASVDATMESALPSFDQKDESSENSFSSSYVADSYSTENNYSSNYQTPPLEQFSSPRFQSINPSHAAPVPEKIIEKIVYQPSKSVSPALFIFFILLLGAGIATVYYFLNKEIKTMSNSHAEQLEKLITANQSSLDYKPLLDLIAVKTTHTITLISADKNSNSFARLFYDPKAEKGLVRIDNLEVLNSEQVYHLWVSVYRSVTSLGTIKFNGVNEFYPVQNFPDIFSLKEATFFITIEPVSGSQNPTSAPILTGLFKN